MTETRPLSFLALGDSYTIGEGVAEGERWPVVLAGRLRSEGLPVGPPEIVATTGWTTDELSAGIDRAAPAGPYQLVTLLIGVNDQYRGREVEQYRPAFVALLERAIAFAGGSPARVVVVSIPDWGVTPFAEGRDRAAIAQALDRYNAVNAEEAGRRGAGYVEVTSISRQLGAAETALVADHLHPSAVQYVAWAERILPAARAALGAG